MKIKIHMKVHQKHLFKYMLQQQISSDSFTIALKITAKII